MSDLDSLEYSVKFPPPASTAAAAAFGNGASASSTTSAGASSEVPLLQHESNGSSNGETDYVFVSEPMVMSGSVAVDEEEELREREVVAGGKVPVIVLLGWAGCQDKYLAKYSQIYEDKGLITLRYITPNKYLFWKHHEMSIIGEKLVQLLSELSLDAHPILLHVFSNGGSCTYQHFSRALERSPRPLMIKGTIFDSTPGCRRIVPLFKAVSAMFGGNRFYNYSISFIITFYVTIWWICEYVVDLTRPKKVGASDIIQYLKTEKNRWPQHCIYSKADDLIPYYDIEGFMDVRKDLGVDITYICFEDSPHVKHYIQHKDSYVNSVYSFVNKCLYSSH